MDRSVLFGSAGAGVRLLCMVLRSAKDRQHAHFGVRQLDSCCGADDWNDFPGRTAHVPSMDRGCDYLCRFDVQPFCKRLCSPARTQPRYYVDQMNHGVTESTELKYYFCVISVFSVAPW